MRRGGSSIPPIGTRAQFARPQPIGSEVDAQRRPVSPVRGDLENGRPAETAMCKEHLLAKASAGTLDDNFRGDAAERAEAVKVRRKEGEWNQSWAARFKREAELLRQRVAEGSSAHPGDGEAAGGDDQRGSAIQRLGGPDLEAGGALHFDDALREKQAHASGSTFALQHVHNLSGGTVAKELSQGLLVIGDAMLLDQGDEVRGRIAGERGPGEVRIGGEKVFRRAVEIGEVAAASAGDEDLLADALRVVQHRDAAAPLRGHHRAHQARGACAEHQYIAAMLGGLRGHPLIMTDPVERRERVDAERPLTVGLRRYRSGIGRTGSGSPAKKTSQSSARATTLLCIPT